KRRSGPADDVDLDAVGDTREAQDWISTPIRTGNPHRVERHRLIQRPAQRLDDAAFDLVAYSVRIDCFAAIDGGHGPHEPQAPALAIDLRFARDRGIRGEILVARESEAASAALLPAVSSPTKTLGSGSHDRARARVFKMAQPEVDRIGSHRPG